MCVLLRNWGIAILPRYFWFVNNRKESEISYSAVSVSKGTGGIAIFAAKKFKTNMCVVSLTKVIVGLASL